MSLIKTNKLQGARLNYAVAVALGHSVHIDAVLHGHVMHGPWISGHVHDQNVWIQLYQFRPSENWARGGQIIDEHIDRLTKLGDREWMAHKTCYDNPEVCYIGYGDTALQAAMRCFVAARLGETVEIPDTLFISNS